MNAAATVEPNRPLEPNGLAIRVIGPVGGRAEENRPRACVGPGALERNIGWQVLWEGKTGDCRIRASGGFLPKRQIGCVCAEG